VGHIIDIMPTFMEMASVEYPDRIGNRKLKPLASKSLLPIFRGKRREQHDVLYWQFGKAKAVRTGDWKLVKLGNADWELYDLNKDRTELNNLASQHPQKVKQMAGKWESWWKKCRE